MRAHTWTVQRRWIMTAVLVTVFAAACSGSEEAADTSSVEPASGDAEMAEDAGAAGAEGLGGEGPPGAPAQGDEAPQPQPPPLDAAPLSPEDRIIKQGTVALEVEEGGFDAAFSRVVDAGRRYGGSVLSSSTRTDDRDGTTSGSVTLRVPSESYEDLLVGVGEIGQVRSRDVTAEDVSEEFVDLESRQRNLEAQERFYLGLLEEAQGVPDAIAVQQQLTTITEQLEQVKGRLAFLDERTRFSTLTVELFEPGAQGPLADDEPGARASLARSWQTAQDAFVNVVGALLVAVFFLAPIVLPALLIGVLAWRLLRRGPRTRVAPPTPPAPAPSPPGTHGADGPASEPPDREPQRTP